MSDRDVALVRAGLEAAAQAAQQLADECGWPSGHETAERISYIDPAAIAATVPETRLCLVCGRNGPCEDAPDACTFDPTPRELYDDNVRLRKELAALKEQKRKPRP